MSEHYLIEFVHHRFGQVEHVAYFSRLHKEAILFWHIILCTIYNYVFSFFFFSLSVARYLSLGHPRVYLRYDQTKITLQIFSHTTLICMPRIRKIKKIRTGDFSPACQRPVYSLFLNIRLRYSQFYQLWIDLF